MGIPRILAVARFLSLLTHCQGGRWDGEQNPAYPSGLVTSLYTQECDLHFIWDTLSLVPKEDARRHISGPVKVPNLGWSELAAMVQWWRGGALATTSKVQSLALCMWSLERWKHWGFSCQGMEDNSSLRAGAAYDIFELSINVLTPLIEMDELEYLRQVERAWREYLEFCEKNFRKVKKD